MFQILWDVVLCLWVSSSETSSAFTVRVQQSSKQLIFGEVQGSVFVKYVRKYSLDDTVSHPCRV